MRSKHLAVALGLVIVWGLNFVAIKVALRTLPPLWLSFLRFFLSAVPAIFLVPRPRVRFTILAGYGLAIFALQFGFLFTGMRAGVPPGLASLVLQVQVFFTMALSMWVFGERPHATRWIGAVVAFAGIAVVALHTDGDVTAAGLALLILAALSWAAGNIVAKRAGAVNPLALVVWGSAVAVGPMLALALVVEGPDAIATAASGLSLDVAAAIGYIVYASTLVGYSLWAFLLNRYPPSTVAPFTLLVPVVGFVGSVLMFGEPLPPWKLAAIALVVGGLAMNLFGARLTARIRAFLAGLGEVAPADEG